MLKLYIHSSDVTVSNDKHSNIRQVLIHDRNLLLGFIQGLSFRGHPTKLREANEVVNHFLAMLKDDSKNLTVENSVMQITMYDPEFVPAKDVDVELGARPPMPFHEILHTTQELTRAMSYNNSSAADTYRNLQALFEKYPELPRK